ncbi:glycosyltransferase family 4 protein [Spongiactinospora sp. TRM90649]|uniref:glycosyltransferase family 4 protein n=1 Tax=Spongiactinospora sp. TRM90649 TaxID=3031114 RepID=UPI0023F8423F|nr:glycosyltransferase family 4 protein [Spongiactinospora sp. TRM90649]MDF5759038.1 glycosyltransferase family 4 protein [Spongiactinospora sp. TRM90649]
MVIAFVLVSYKPDTPAGIERATAALAAGLRQRGHETPIISGIGDLDLNVSFPADDATLRHALDSGLREQIANILVQRKADIVVYTDALWGAGRAMAVHPARKVLAVHVIGPDQDLRPALASAEAVIAPSATVLHQAAERGHATEQWHIVPNALLHDESAWLDDARRERLRRRGPIRVLSRPAPEKGVEALLSSAPPTERPVQVILARAPFEDQNGGQAEIVRRCLALRTPGVTVRTCGLAWRHVPGWLSNAAVVIVPSHAETFGLVALEAMSVGTPVVAYDVGNLPELIGTGGVIVKRGEGPDGLWRAAAAITEDPVTYLRTSRAAYYRSRDFRPTTIADTFLKAVW